MIFRRDQADAAEGISINVQTLVANRIGGARGTAINELSHNNGVIARRRFRLIGDPVLLDSAERFLNLAHFLQSLV